MDFRNTVIFTPYLKSLPVSTNLLRLAAVKDYLDYYLIPYTIAKGKYKDSLEASIVVSIKYEAIAYQLARQYKQESVLRISGLNIANLEYLDTNKKEFIGILTEVPQLVAENTEGYTEYEGRYYVYR